MQTARQKHMLCPLKALFPGETSDVSEHGEDAAAESPMLDKHPKTRKNSYIWSGDNYVPDKVVEVDSREIHLHVSFEGPVSPVPV